MPAATRAQPWQMSNRSDSAGGSEGGTELADSPEVSSGCAGADLLGSGAHIIGNDAVELLGELVLGMSSELDAQTFLHSIHSHPTSSEAVMEAVADALGVSVHI